MYNFTILSEIYNTYGGIMNHRLDYNALLVLFLIKGICNWILELFVYYGMDLKCDNSDYKDIFFCYFFLTHEKRAEAFVSFVSINVFFCTLTSAISCGAFETFFFNFSFKSQAFIIVRTNLFFTSYLLHLNSKVWKICVFIFFHSDCPVNLCT